MKTGSIQHANINEGLFSVLLEDGNYSIFETTHIQSFKVQDTISGHLDLLGVFEVLNASQQRYRFVHIQYVGLKQEEAMEIIFR